MFVKYGAGTSGIENYLINGQSKHRNFTRDELDHRIILNGNLNDVSMILNHFNKKTANGDNYKHFILNFKENNLKPEIIKQIDLEFKNFITSSYEENELYYYSEIHYPKLWGYVLKNNDFSNRKPHVHVVIPVFNLYTGNKGFNFNYHTYNFNEYLKSFSKYINHKYNLISPYVLENRQLISDNSIQITKKSGKSFYNFNIEIKKEILKEIVLKDLKTNEQLINYIKIIYPNLKIKSGKLNNNILILEKEEKEIVLKDFCFTNEFLSLSKPKKNILYLNYLNHYQNDLNNILHITKENYTLEDEINIEEYKTIVSKTLKYSKIINKNDLNTLLNLQESSLKKEFLNLKEKEFYERKPTKKYSRGSFKYKIGDEEYFNIITRNISESNSIIENTKLNFGKTKRQFSSVDFNSISHNNFIKLIEINFGFCSKSIKIKNNEYIYNNKIFKTNIDLFKELPILKEDKQKYYIKIIEKIEKIKIFDELFDNFNFNFYNDKNNNKFIEDILEKYIYFKKESKPVQINGIINEFYDLGRIKDNIYKNNENFKNELQIISNKYKNLTKLKNINIKNLKITHLSTNKTLENLQEKFKNFLKKELTLNRETIINKSFMFFLAQYFNKNNQILSNDDKKNIIGFLLINNLLTKDDVNINNDYIEKIKNIKEIVKITEEGEIILDNQIININKTIKINEYYQNIIGD